jgi:hypothetical protein
LNLWTIPRELNLFTGLQVLDLSQNQFKYQEYMYNHPRPMVREGYRNELYFLETYKIYRFLRTVGTTIKENQELFRSGY